VILYIVVIYGGLCKKGGKDRQWHSCSEGGNTNHNIDVVWCLSFTAETLDFLYQYCVERCMLEVELKQLSSSSNYIESFHYLQDQCDGWDQAQDNGC